MTITPIGSGRALFPIITDFRALWPVLAPAQQKPKEVSYGR